MFMSLIYTSLFISSIGIFMLLSKKHILSILIGIELFLNGINLFFITDIDKHVRPKDRKE